MHESTNIHIWQCYELKAAVFLLVPSSFVHRGTFTGFAAAFVSSKLFWMPFYFREQPTILMEAILLCLLLNELDNSV